MYGSGTKQDFVIRVLLSVIIRICGYSSFVLYILFFYKNKMSILFSGGTCGSTQSLMPVRRFNSNPIPPIKNKV